ncbi:auxin efflux carrier family protein [Striga asiatica]|uniref:Auxin efflux carrier family protein n=1 Tax=Striga asiatica TaxID=4170 RepID=A0A5A7Q8M6_STRAF|nr:auxin efflux carrier family protein [Striga asiatica]
MPVPVMGIVAKVTRASLGVSGGENGVDEHKGADDLRTKRGSLVVAVGHRVGPAAEAVVVALHEGLHQADPADRAKVLRHHVQNGPYQGDLPGEEKPERHGRVDVTT